MTTTMTNTPEAREKVKKSQKHAVMTPKRDGKKTASVDKIRSVGTGTATQASRALEGRMSQLKEQEKAQGL